MEMLLGWLLVMALPLGALVTLIMVLSLIYPGWRGLPQHRRLHVTAWACTGLVGTYSLVVMAYGDPNWTMFLAISLVFAAMLLYEGGKQHGR
ncbi:MAG: hypothetical protein IT317_13640 [Anaerolineales bacterium]|nr:hypothetical protein [Anaerolineales bacterium]